MTTDLAVPADLQAEVPSILAWARGLFITDNNALVMANDGLKRIKTTSKKIDEFFDPLIRQSDTTTKAIRESKKLVAGPLLEAEGLVKTSLINYQTEQRAQAEAEQQRLQAEADAKAARERADLEKRAAQAKKPETIERYQQAAAQVAAPVIRVDHGLPKLAGTAIRRTWKARVVEPGLVPRDFLMVDEKKLNAYATAMKELAKVPGVEFYTQETLASRGA